MPFTGGSMSPRNKWSYNNPTYNWFWGPPRRSNSLTNHSTEPWFICLQDWVVFYKGVNVGKYTIQIHPVGLTFTEMPGEFTSGHVGCRVIGIFPMSLKLIWNQWIPKHLKWTRSFWGNATPLSLKTSLAALGTMNHASQPRTWMSK